MAIIVNTEVLLQKQCCSPLPPRLSNGITCNDDRFFALHWKGVAQKVFILGYEVLNVNQSMQHVAEPNFAEQIFPGIKLDGFQFLAQLCCGKIRRCKLSSVTLAPATRYVQYCTLMRFILKVLVFWPFQFQEKEKTNSGNKHIKQITHVVFNLTFLILIT